MSSLVKRGGSAPWAVLAVYLVVSALLHSLWEAVQVPLYTIWTAGSWGEVIFAVVHCTGGDVLIAAATLGFSLLVTGGWRWPCQRGFAVPALTVLVSVAYTAFSEWRNVYVAKAWAYTPSMPTLDVFGYAIGVSPLLQWLIVPTAALWCTRQWLRRA